LHLTRPATQHAMPHRRTRARGFTLVELMVVIVIIGIMSAMIIPEMRGSYQDALLRSTSRRLVDVCSLASSRAITLHQPQRVRLDTKAGRYYIERADRDTQGASGFARVRELPGGDGELDPRISIAIRKRGEEGTSSSERRAAPDFGDASANLVAAGAIGFFADGTAEAAEILLQDQEGFRLSLRINPTTARVHIAQLERESAISADTGGSD